MHMVRLSSYSLSQTQKLPTCYSVVHNMQTTVNTDMAWQNLNLEIQGERHERKSKVM